MAMFWHGGATRQFEAPFALSNAYSPRSGTAALTNAAKKVLRIDHGETDVSAAPRMVDRFLFIAISSKVEVTVTA